MAHNFYLERCILGFSPKLWKDSNIHSEIFYEIVQSQVDSWLLVNFFYQIFTDDCNILSF